MTRPFSSLVRHIVNVVFLGCICAIVLGAGASRPTSAQNQAAPIAPPVCDFYFDRSGSMKGFNAPGVPQRELERLKGAFLERCNRVTTFNDGQDALSSSFAPDMKFSGDTNIEAAFGHWLKAGETPAAANETKAPKQRRQLVLVTDNVTSVAGNGNGEDVKQQEDFYKLLSDPANRLSHISVLLMRLPFNGPVYGRDGRSFTNYPASGEPLPRALTVYLIEQNGDKDDDQMFTQAKANLTSRFGAGSVIDALDPGTVADYKKKIVRLRLQPFTPIVPDKTAKTSVDITNLSPGLTVVTSQTSPDVKRYVYNLSSREKGKIAGDGAFKWTASWSLKSSPFKVRWVPTGDEAQKALATTLFGKQIDCTTDKDKVAFPAVTGASTPFKFTFSCPLQSNFSGLTTAQQIELGENGKIRIEGEIQFIIDVQKATDLELQGPVRTAFDLPSGTDFGLPQEDVQGKINELSGLIANMIPASQRSVADSNPIPLAFDVNPPAGAALTNLVASWWWVILLIAGAIGLLVWQLSSVARFRITGSGDLDKTIALKPFASYRANLGSGNNATVGRAFGLLYLSGSVGFKLSPLGAVITKAAAATSGQPAARRGRRDRTSTPPVDSSAANSGVWIRIDRALSTSDTRPRRGAAASTSSTSARPGVRGRRGGGNG